MSDSTNASQQDVTPTLEEAARRLADLSQSILGLSRRRLDLQSGAKSSG